MVIDSMFDSRFVDPDLTVEIFFEKEGHQKMGALILNRRYRPQGNINGICPSKC